ncbi:MAG: kynureninase [Alphaproteobacteria bacterium]|nr:kynureninase [Alphaproteobacteria bacterium]
MSLARQHALDLDARDPLAHARERFAVPDGIIYLDGNSLGCLPKTVAPRLHAALEKEWGVGLIRSWNDAGWYTAPQRVGAKIAKLIGAAADEVIVTDSTSVDLFKVLAAALRLRPNRQTILGVNGDFPTDAYIAGGIAGLTGKQFVRVDASALIDTIGADTAIVVLTHVNYKTAVLHDMRAITNAAHAKGALVVWDLSHSAGVMPLEVAKLDADFAVGCGYKHLNGGPGAPAYIYAAKRHHEAIDHPLTGWLGHADPFAFAADYAPAQGMDKLLTGTPPILSLLALDAALDAFDGLDLHQIRAKVESLTGLFVALAEERLVRHGFTLASPRDAKQRGAHIALSHPEGYAIMQAIIARGLIGDFRAPDIVRFGFAPLYTRHADVFDAVALIDEVMSTQAWDTPEFKARKSVT